MAFASYATATNLSSASIISATSYKDPILHPLWGLCCVYINLQQIKLLKLNR